MRKPLSEMTLEELWQLFPIFLVQHKEEWNHWYQEEGKRLLQLLPSKSIKRISHIGSPAISNIWAKDIVDMLLEVSKDSDLQYCKRQLLNAGYLLMSEEKNRMSFNKDYTEAGFAKKVFHLHLRYQGDHDELYFRDYLREHPKVLQKYEAFKTSFMAKYEHHRDAYTDAKTDFIKKYTQKAKENYKGRYK